MAKFGLALSGGGFRATLYHLGVIRFLRDAGVLQNVTNIASVSGGSILSAHLALNWDRYNGDDSAFADAADEIVKFVKFDLRNHIARRIPLQLPLRVVARLPFIDRRKFTPNALLEDYYSKFLYGGRCLYELPEQPALHILATAISTGALSVFNREGLFIQKRDESGNENFQHIPGQLASISNVVGASSAFPGFFPPVEINAADLGVRDGQFATEFFTDGGVYDNLGLRAFSWLKQQHPDFDQILVSDAGKPFQILNNGALGFIGQSVRASDILWDRVGQLERENFSAQEGFLFLPIGDTIELSDDKAAMHPVIQSEIQSIRTDLDQFSDDEISALCRHGYEISRKVFCVNKIVEANKIPEGPPWSPIAQPENVTQSQDIENDKEPSLTTKISRRLHESSYRRIISTFFDWRDWPSYVYIFIAFLIFFIMPLQVFQLYQKSQRQAAIISSIASGDPDIRYILNLADTDPTSGWGDQEIADQSQPTKASFDGVEILTHSRIYDLRRWRPDQEDPDDRGHVFIRDRITLKLLNSYKGDGIVTIRVPVGGKDVQFRHAKGSLPGKISRIKKSEATEGKTKTFFEFQYDLFQAPKGEPATIIVEMIGSQFPKTVRAPFKTHAKTDLISVWMLFPEDKPYRTYNLVSYPIDGSQAPNAMDSRYAIDHPYGSFIGWSVVDPKEDWIYECRWTSD